MSAAPASLFGVVGILYGVLVPLAILGVIAIVFIPSIHIPGAKPWAVGKAIYCSFMQALGLLLMTIGGLPAVYGVLARQPYESVIYIALLLVFSAGGLTFLWHDHLLRSVDENSRSVPSAIFFLMFKVLGYGSVLFAALSLVLTMLLGFEEEEWWVMPTIMLLYGLLLSWCTRFEAHAPQSFRSAPMVTPQSRPSAFPRPAMQRMVEKAKMASRPAPGKKRR
ncbi:MAG: hypothetical protein Q7R81_03960 [Candidatus Peregrinibacteria bacterium]|nr:hypothetical protein [Candidatus Peregrinibacteria bacterium]